MPGRSISRALICLAFLAAAVMVPRISHAAGSSFTVQRIRVIGLERISRTTVLTYMPGISVGQTVDPAQIATAIKNLYQTGFFSRIQFRRDGGTLIVAVTERPTIAQVVLSGNKAIKTPALKKGLKQAGLTQGQFFNRSTLSEIQSTLLQAYFDHGRYGVKINTSVRQLQHNRVSIRFNIKEGTVAKVVSINITGNHHFSDSTLRDQFKISEKGWLTFLSDKDKYEQEKLRGSLENLRSFYMNRGYADFHINSVQVQISPDKSKIYINVNLHEGGKYKVGDVKFLGKFVLPEKKLRHLIFIKKGSSFSMEAAHAESNLITNVLGSYGYGFAKVTPVPKPDPKTHTVNLVLYMKPGQRVYVRHVNFSGAPGTDDTVFRREMRQSEDSWLNDFNIKRSKVRIQRLPFVDNVDIKRKRVPGTSDMVDVNVKVKERRSGTVQGSVFYSGYYGFGVGGQIALANFLGRGDTVHLNVNRNTLRTSASLSYTNPYATVNGVSRTTSLFYEEGQGLVRTASPFNTRNYGGSVSYSFPLSEFDRYDLGATLRHGVLTPYCYSSQQFSQFVSNPANGSVSILNSYCPGRDPDVPINDKLYVLTYNNVIANLGYTHDTRNRTILPTRGTMQNLSLALATPLGTESYYNFTWNQMTFVPIKAGFIFGVESLVGVSSAYGRTAETPPYEHFFAGGPQSVAGYYSATLSPLDSNGGPYGGNFVTWVQNELILPNFIGSGNGAPSYRIALFLDAGNVFAKPKDFNFGLVRASYGIGVTWLTPIGALRFSYAIPFHFQPYDNLQRFQFTVGGYF